jgi:FkbM family methyltransferase
VNDTRHEQYISESFAHLVRRSQADIAPVPEWAVRTETVIGPLWLHREDRVMTPWIQTYHSWEENTHAFLLSALTPGMHVLDIGANIGYITIIAARAVGPEGTVLALEPAPDNFALLCANLDAAGVTNVLALQIAASDFTGETRLWLSDSNKGDHRTSLAHTWEQSTQVACARVDDLLCTNAPVDFIKLDIQGAEHRAIRGMARLLARCNPQLLAEFWPLGIREAGDDPETVLHIYRAVGSQIAFLEDTSVSNAASDAEIVRVVEALQGGFGTLVLRGSHTGAAMEASVPVQMLRRLWTRLTGILSVL